MFVINKQQNRNIMINWKIVVGFLLILAILSCKKDQVNPLLEPCKEALTNLDTVYLNPSSIEFMPYTGEESLIFINENGEEAKFESETATRSHRFQTIDFSIDCAEGNVNFYRMERELYAVFHRCEALELRHYFNINVWSSDIKPLLFDNFSLVFHRISPPNSNNDTFIELNLIPHYRGNEAALMTEFPPAYDFLEEIELLDKSFTNVYRVTKENHPLTILYFNKEFGIIGFKDLNQQLWVFDRFE